MWMREDVLLETKDEFVASEVKLLDGRHDLFAALTGKYVVYSELTCSTSVFSLV